MKNPLHLIIQKGDIHRNFFLQLKDSKRILEIGCGRGGNCSQIHSLFPGIEIYGVDLIPQSEVPAFVHYTRVDLENGRLPFENNSFDAVLAIYVLEHIQNAIKLGTEINRIMKNGGLIFIEVPNWTTMFVPSFGFHRVQHNPFNFFDDPSHVKIWTKQSLFEFLDQGCCFSTKKIGTNRNWAALFFNFFQIIKGLCTGRRERVLLPFWNIFGWNIYAIGSKKVDDPPLNPA